MGECLVWKVALCSLLAEFQLVRTPLALHGAFPCHPLISGLPDTCGKHTASRAGYQANISVSGQEFLHQAAETDAVDVLICSLLCCLS